MNREQYQPAINEAYIQALIFTDVNDDSEWSESFTGDLSPEAMAKCNSDCCDFVDLLVKEGLFEKTLEVMTPEQIGHDFWLTRNGHGAGFWDRGNGELGETLSSLAKIYGDVSVYQDGKFNIQIG
jgi:hypothetical protein